VSTGVARELRAHCSAVKTPAQTSGKTKGESPLKRYYQLEPHPGVGSSVKTVACCYGVTESGDGGNEGHGICFDGGRKLG